MAQEVYSFFSLGGPRNVADPAVAEAQAQQQINLQRQALAQQQQAAMLDRQQQAAQAQQRQSQFLATLGLDRERLSEQGRQFDVGQANTMSSQEADRAFRALLQGNQFAQDDKARGDESSLRKFLQGNQQQFASTEAAKDRTFRGEQSGLDRTQQATLAQLQRTLQERLATMQETGQNTRQGNQIASTEKIANMQDQTRRTESAADRSSREGLASKDLEFRKSRAEADDTARSQARQDQNLQASNEILATVYQPLMAGLASEDPAVRQSAIDQALFMAQRSPDPSALMAIQQVIDQATGEPAPAGPSALSAFLGATPVGRIYENLPGVPGAELVGGALREYLGRNTGNFAADNASTGLMLNPLTMLPYAGLRGTASLIELLGGE